MNTTSNPVRASKVTDADQNRRREIVSATVGGLGALAFAPLAGIIRDFSKEFHRYQSWEVNTLIFLAILFFFTEVAFFLGIQTYLRGRVEEPDVLWVIDFGSTIITLALLVILGSIATPVSKEGFLWTLGAIYLFQGLWALAHVGLAWWHNLETWTELPRVWAFGDPILGLVIVAVCYFASELTLPALAFIGLAYFGRLGWEFCELAFSRG